jgi:hydrogenase-4 component B
MMTIRLMLISVMILGLSGVPGMLTGPRRFVGRLAATTLNIIASLLGMMAVVLFWIYPAGPHSADLTWGLPLGQFDVGLDGISPIFLIPMFVVSALGSIYGLGYWTPPRHLRNSTRLSLCWGLMTASMVMVVLARDGVLLVISWEIMALAGFFLVTTEDQKSEVREAGWVYLVAAHVGALCLFGFFALLRFETGSFELWPALGPTVLSTTAGAALFVLGIIGFGIKAGIVPLHVWLPGAHANAPSHVSAMMSGVLLKTGIYGIVRVAALLPHPPIWWGASLLVVGVLSGIVGIALAAGQRDLKRLLAYSSVENMGIVVLGIGLALLGRSVGNDVWIVLGLGGALLHVLNHSLFKPLLFMSAGSILHATRTRLIDLMGGLGRRMPKTFTLFVVGAMAICGLPPLNGFVSEFLIYLGLLRGIAAGSQAGGWIALGAPALALIGALAVASFVKVVGVVFAGAPRSGRGAAAHDPPVSMIGPIAALSGGCVMIGVAPSIVVPLLDAAIAQWMPAGSDKPVVLTALAPFGWMSLTAVLLLSLIAAGLIWFSRSHARQAARAGLTWDCGYLRPTARMQYSGSSFSQMLVELLSWALWPRRQLPDPRGVFAGDTSFASDVPDAVLDRGLMPVFGTATLAIGRARVLQRGTVQLYLLYVLGILVTLLLWG